MFEAGIFDWAKHIVTDQAWAIIVPLILAYIAKKVRDWLKPYLDTKEKKDMAAWIAHIADDVTDELVLKYPKEKWADFLDKAVDKIIDITGIKPEVAVRAAKAAVARKKNG